MSVETLPVSEVKFREDLYPRIKHDPALVQRYAENLEVLPPIEVNQHFELIDGYHRWTAHRKVEAEFLSLAIRRNSAHGWQMDERSKRKAAVRLYGAGTGVEKSEIAEILSVTKRMVTSYLQDIDRRLKEERQETIFNLWISCHTQEEIAEAVGIPQRTVSDEIETFSGNGNASKIAESLDFGVDPEFSPQIYNIWSFSAKTNAVAHFGNSEQTIVDNLLYLYTEPFDIVLDPFAGGGSTIDVCRRRLRRYWVSDRLPIPERENEIRCHDIVSDGLPPLNRNWSQVSLTYLDPPYWRQAQGKYSDAPSDLANMSLEDFVENLSGLITGISKKQSKGVIALLIQPTQWNAPERKVVDHVIDIIKAVKSKRLLLESRISCPYSTEQYNAQQSKWAKENKKLLVPTRELIVWRVEA